MIVQVNPGERPALAAFALVAGFAGVMLSQLAWFDKRRTLRGALLASGICALSVAVLFYVWYNSAAF